MGSKKTVCSPAPTLNFGADAPLLAEFSPQQNVLGPSLPSSLLWPSRKANIDYPSTPKCCFWPWVVDALPSWHSEHSGYFKACWCAEDATTHFWGFNWRGFMDWSSYGALWSGSCCFFYKTINGICALAGGILPQVSVGPWPSMAWWLAYTAPQKDSGLRPHTLALKEIKTWAHHPSGLNRVCVCVLGRRGITRRRFMPSFGLLLGNRKCLLSLFLERGGVKLDSVTICPEPVDFLLSCPLFLSNNWLFPFADKDTVGDVALHQQVGLWQPPNRPITGFLKNI